MPPKPKLKVMKPTAVSDTSLATAVSSQKQEYQAQALATSGETEGGYTCVAVVSLCERARVFVSHVGHTVTC